MMGKMTENEVGYENLVEKENKMRRENDKKYITQDANRVKLQKSIGAANDLVKLSKKKIK